MAFDANHQICTRDRRPKTEAAEECVSGNSWSLALGWTIATPNSALLTKTGELVDSPAA